MISNDDARVAFIDARVTEIWEKINGSKECKEYKEFRDQEEELDKIVKDVWAQSPENKELMSELESLKNLLLGDASHIFYAAGLRDGMKMLEHMAEACQKVIMGGY